MSSAGAAAGASSAPSASSEHEPWSLVYWPMLPGRGEFLRVVMESFGIPYTDDARLKEKEAQGSGVGLVVGLMKGEGQAAAELPIASPPVLRSADGKTVILSQTMNSVLYLSEVYALPGAETRESRYELNSLLLTIADVVAEVHDTHHPLGTHLAYEEADPAACATRATAFRETRIAKFTAYFERHLAANAARHGEASTIGIHGTSLGPADVCLWHLYQGLAYAFPRAYKARVTGTTAPRLTALLDAVPTKLDKLDAYLKSDRRLPFGQDGIFRQYPELDDKAADE